MAPDDLLRQKREEILRIAAKHGARNVRVFGSVVRGEADEISDIDFLRDILEAIAAIERYLDRDKAAFEKDELLQSWFLRHLQIIGEAARALPEQVRARAPEIP